MSGFSEHELWVVRQMATTQCALKAGVGDELSRIADKMAAMGASAEELAAPRPRPRSTHTIATLEVSDAVFDDIAFRLREAGYDHVIDVNVIDMSGLGLTRRVQTIKTANTRQVGGNHYGGGAIQHWDLAVMFKWDAFQYQITKYVMRWKKKNGLQDLEKAGHFLEKYIEEIRAGRIENPTQPTNDT